MKYLLISIILLLLSTLAFGQVPNSFSSGETISSSKINANFAYVASAIKNDNISAMMICENSGFCDDVGNSCTSEDYYYANCYATNDQSFESSVKIRLRFTKKTRNSDFYSTTTTTTMNRAISFKNIFSNKWILYNSKVVSAAALQGGTINDYDMYLFEKHIFYKVSSD